MLTIIESPLFTKLWPDYWSDEEHTKFTAFLAGKSVSHVMALENVEA